MTYTRDMTFRRPRFSIYQIVIYVIWAILAVELVIALVDGRYSLSFIALATLALSVAPMVAASRLGIRLPLSFLAGIVFFIFGTLYLGEVFDFYERYWWWDVLMHFGSAMGFGLVGFVIVFLLFEGERYRAPHAALAFIAFCISITIGALWEIFEFAMDQIFGLNMQKSGLPDTMGDLIVDTIGAAIGAGAGYAYLEGRSRRGLPGVVAEFIAQNRRLFQRRLGRHAGRRNPR